MIIVVLSTVSCGVNQLTQRQIEINYKLDKLYIDYSYERDSLINEFYKITGIPMLGNTSLNLAGQPLVNEIEDLKKFKNNIMIYFPELNKIYSNKCY